jgi:uncharacterized membrane protein YczE
MKQLVIRITKLFVGLSLYAIGIVLTINANLGLAPWDIFHQGLAKLVNITIGQASIAVGLVLVILDAVLGERVGWGTIGNMLFIGWFMDILMLNNIIPVFDNIVIQVLMMFTGMFVVGIASYFYLSAGLGSGPRDGIMVALTKRSDKSVRFIRNSIETSALILGYFMGGYVGAGTFVMALTTGYFIQFAFKIFKFEVREVQHRFIDDDFKYLWRKFKRIENHSEAE